MTTKNGWYDIATGLDSVVTVCGSIHTDRELPLDIRREAMEAEVALAKLAATIKIHCSKPAAIAYSQTTLSNAWAGLTQAGHPHG